MTAAAVLALVAAVACGRRGPPLEPFVRVPDGVETISARRVGDEVFVTLTVPSQNVDASLPVAIDRIQVWAYTGVTPPVAADWAWAEVGTPVATVPVEVPDPDAPPALPLAPGVAPSGPARPTEVIVVRDLLTPDQLVQGPEPVVEDEEAAVALRPVALPATPPPLQRYYAAFSFAPDGRPGPPGAVAAFVLVDPPPAPEALRVAYTEAQLALTWAPAGGLLGFLLDAPLAAEPVPFGVRLPPAPAVAPVAAALAGPTRYNVYATAPPAPTGPPALDAAGGTWRARPALPVNLAPASATAFSEPVRFGVERCFVVRAERGTGVNVAESAPSPEICVTAEDVFAPSTPVGLAAVPTAGSISLIWAPNTEADLAGYLVLRGEAGAVALAPVTAEPVREARFLDDNVTSGVRYQYAVVAVDGRVPVPNRSTPSARVEATAR